MKTKQLIWEYEKKEMLIYRRMEFTHGFEYFLGRVLFVGQDLFQQQEGMFPKPKLSFVKPELFPLFVSYFPLKLAQESLFPAGHFESFVGAHFFLTCTILSYMIFLNIFFECYTGIQ
jgi:hypothetical protein